MQFSNIPSFLEAYYYCQLKKKAFDSTRLYLIIQENKPLVLEDSNKIKLSVADAKTDYEKLGEAGSHVCLVDSVIKLDSSKNVSIVCKNVVSNIGEKENRNKGMEIKLRVDCQEGDQFTPASLGYLRRLEKQEIFGKLNKNHKTDLTAFTSSKQAHKNKNSTVPAEISTLDHESLSILKNMLPFVDKEDLFRVLIKKPLKDKYSKKMVRMAVVPTDASDNETLEIKKVSYNRNSILELLGEYDARDQRMKEE